MAMACAVDPNGPVCSGGDAGCQIPCGMLGCSRQPDLCQLSPSCELLGQGNQCLLLRLRNSIPHVSVTCSGSGQAHVS